MFVMVAQRLNDSRPESNSDFISHTKRKRGWLAMEWERARTKARRELIWLLWFDVQTFNFLKFLHDDKLWELILLYTWHSTSIQARHIRIGRTDLASHQHCKCAYFSHSLAYSRARSLTLVHLPWRQRERKKKTVFIASNINI